MSDVPKDLQAGWALARLGCPHCATTGCERCGGSGDLLAHVLEQAYLRGREDALVQMREVFRVAKLAGEQASSAPVPELKRWSGL